VENKNTQVGEEEKTMAGKVTIIVHSGDMDKIYSALIVANGALAMGMEASLFFTFWGLQRLKKGELEKGPLSKNEHAGPGQMDGQAEDEESRGGVSGEAVTGLPRAWREDTRLRHDNADNGHKERRPP